MTAGLDELGKILRESAEEALRSNPRGTFAKLVDTMAKGLTEIATAPGPLDEKALRSYLATCVAGIHNSATRAFMGDAAVTLKPEDIGGEP